MARRIIFKEGNNLSGTLLGGLRAVGYNGTVISEQYGATVSAIGGGGNTYGKFGIADSFGQYTYYTTLTLAMTDATAGQTIEQFADVTETGAVTISWKNGVNFNGNGHTYTHSHAAGNSTTINLPTAVTSTIANWRVIRTGRANGTSTDYVFTMSDTGFSNNASVITFNNVYMESTYGTAVYISMGAGLYQGSLYGKGYLYGVFAHSEIRGVTGESTAATAGIYLGNSKSAYQCVGISVSGQGIRNNGGISMVNCIGRSTSNIALEGGIHINCIGISVSSSGGQGNGYGSTYISSSGVAGDGLNGTNNIMLSSSGYGWYTFFPNYRVTNSVIVSTGNAAAVTRGTILKNCVIRSEYDNASGHAVAEWIGGSTTKVINCDLEVANTSANCLNSPTAITMKYANCSFDGATTPVNANITQGISNTQDSQGNIPL